MEPLAAPAAISTRNRIPELDGLRAVAIAAVFLHHALRLPLLWAGVDVFFVLSGFLITGILLDAKAHSKNYFRHFYSRRARRILPAYWVALLLLSLLFGWAWLHRWYWFVFFATNIGETIQRSQFSLQPLWSLAVEEQFYLVWPCVVLLARERTLLWIAAAGVVLAPILRFVCTPLFPNHFAVYFLTPFRADLLCAGALLVIVWRGHRPKFLRAARWWWAPVVLAMAILAWLNRFPAWHTQSNTPQANAGILFLTLVISCALLAGALRGQGPLSALLRLPPVRYIGVISYSMYLVHTGAIELGRRWFGQSWKMVVVAAALTIAYASIAWFGWERRILGHYGAKRRLERHG
jgi:peptidoglycan/LPS O-acetylase OafA/YrhL